EILDARGLLRRHVGELSLELTDPRGRQTARGAGDAEVRDAGDAVRTHQDVLGRDVSMDEADELARLVPQLVGRVQAVQHVESGAHRDRRDRKSTRLNSSHVKISYAVF